MMYNNSSDPFGNFSAKKSVQQRRVTNFLEAFKENAVQRPLSENRSDSFLEAFKASALKKSAILENNGELKPGVPLSVSEALKQEESLKRQEQARAEERFLAKQREEEQQALLAAKQKEVNRQIEELRQVILKIAKSTSQVSREIEKAAFEAPVAAGTYHLTFFEKLKSTLELIKRRLDDSASWLHTMNERSKKRVPYFWAQVQKSGTKYMLSSERYMQMAAG